MATSSKQSLGEALASHYGKFPVEKLEESLEQLNSSEGLPHRVSLIKPLENPEVKQVWQQFLAKYYGGSPSDRALILGINPGRFGSGQTGLSFTDPHCLKEFYKMPLPLPDKRELSASFFWLVICSFGGPELFYSKFTLDALLPFGLLKHAGSGRLSNCNFYDYPELLTACLPYIEEHLQGLLALGLRRDIAYCIGSGQNLRVLKALNQRLALFERVVSLDHPRFIMQYRLKQKDEYINRYLDSLSLALES